MKKQYAVPIYNYDEIHNISNEHLEFTISEQLFFETLLLEIRGKTISYSIAKKRKNDQEETKLVKLIELLEKDPNLNNENMLQLEEYKLKLQELREIKLRGMIIQSRVNWLQHGEKTK